jgi:hypothetical protein
MLNIFYSPFVKIRYTKETGLVLVQHFANPYGNPSEQKEMSLEEFCSQPKYSLYKLDAIRAAGRKVTVTA